jgi:hypothetical protein
MDSKVPVQMNSDQRIVMMEDLVERMVAAVGDGDYVTFEMLKKQYWEMELDLITLAQNPVSATVSADHGTSGTSGLAGASIIHSVSSHSVILPP